MPCGGVLTLFLSDARSRHVGQRFYNGVQGIYVVTLCSSRFVMSLHAQLFVGSRIAMAIIGRDKCCHCHFSDLVVASGPNMLQFLKIHNQYHS